MVELALMLACLSGQLEPALSLAIIEQESGGDPIALNVNRFHGERPAPATAHQTIEQAEHFIEAGFSVDVGLMGINSRNFDRLGLSLEQAVQPCANIAAGERILVENLDTARQRYPGHADRLSVALSLYNTGSPTRGIANGYVAGVLGRRGAIRTRLARTASSSVAWRTSSTSQDTGPTGSAAPSGAMAPLQGSSALRDPAQASRISWRAVDPPAETSPQLVEAPQP